MAIDMSGKDTQPGATLVPIKIEDSHPLIRLVKLLPWGTLMELVLEDLKKTTAKGCWWMGRKLVVRIHLGAYILQRLYNMTDRKIEYQLRDNAAFQLFCGLGAVTRWHAPDHTKIEKFRNRLSPETHRLLANISAKIAVDLGFADPTALDLDSTAQEANIAYPSDACLMIKLITKGKKLVDYLRDKLNMKAVKSINFDLEAVKKKAKEYFFLAKNKSFEIKREVFKDLHQLTKKEMKPVVELARNLSRNQLGTLPWNIKRIFDVIKDDSWRYLLDVAHFIRRNKIKKGKILSFHSRAVACIKKGKAGKEMEFGRVFQLGRIGGNFMFSLGNTSIGMNDKKSFVPMIEEHMKLFGPGTLKTVAADKGYWSLANKKSLEKLNLRTEGLQRPGRVGSQVPESDLKEALHNRRAGIEPLIGHSKHGGQLGKSRMKSDLATLGAGYGSILGMNLRQMIRHQQGKMK